MFSPYEEEAYKKGYTIVAGIDEAGRGPLAGPVVAAACYIKPKVQIAGVQDSKTLSPKRRKACYAHLREHPDVHIAIGMCSPQEIDQFNILQATFIAMNRAVDRLQPTPDFLLIDGNKAPQTEIDHLAVVKGDSCVFSIAAASICAKEYRDALMEEYHEQYPEYNFAQHKGYPTKTHRDLVRLHGPSPIHRTTFMEKILCL